jgi:hypothetical protein
MDVLMVAMAVFLVAAVLAVGLLYLRLHSLPEHLAHKSSKLQYEIIAVLCLLALFTHVHLFWVAALLLAFIDIPDFGGPLDRMATSLERIADIPPDERAAEVPDETSDGITRLEVARAIAAQAEDCSSKHRELIYA